MIGLFVLSAILCSAAGRSSVLQVSPLSSLQTRTSASASASSLPQQLTVLRLLPNAPLDPDSQVLDTLETSLENAEETGGERLQGGNLAKESARNVVFSPLVSASSSASASSSVSDTRSLLSTLDASCPGCRAVELEALDASCPGCRVAQLASQSTQAVQAQSQQQVSAGPGSLLTATRLAQSLASSSPTGASSSSSVQVVESPELTAARAQQALLVTRHSNGLPLLVNADGQLVAPLLLL